MMLGLPIGAAAFWKQGEEEKASVQALNAEWLARGMKGYSGLLRVKDRDRLMVETRIAWGLSRALAISGIRRASGISVF